MVNAVELRVGNYIKCKVSNDAGIYQVDGIKGWKRIFSSKEDEERYKRDTALDLYAVADYKPVKWHDERLVEITGGARDGEIYPESRLAPVSITEKWLEAFGFERTELGKDKTGDDVDSYFYSKSLKDEKYCDLSILSYSAPMASGKIKLKCYLFPYETFNFEYVHQLQNVWMAITGEELELTTTKNLIALNQ